MDIWQLNLKRVGEDLQRGNHSVALARRGLAIIALSAETAWPAVTLKVPCRRLRIEQLRQALHDVRIGDGPVFPRAAHHDDGAPAIPSVDTHHDTHTLHVAYVDAAVTLAVRSSVHPFNLLFQVLLLLLLLERLQELSPELLCFRSNNLP